MRGSVKVGSGAVMLDALAISTGRHRYYRRTLI